MLTLLLAALLTQDPAELARDRGLNKERPRDHANPGLWYGQPGVRPGGDLIAPILELIRRPEGLFDFRPRRDPGYENADLERFNRIYEQGLELPRRDVPPDR
jgi:hypothetical protein